MKNINCSQLEVKPRRRLTKAERAEFVLTQDLKSILVGLYLGALYVEKLNINPRLRFEQGLIHDDYLLHFYKLFEKYCPANPRISIRPPNKITGIIHSSIWFRTYTLACFHELYNLFYPAGQKIVPLNIAELVNPLSLAYWLCDD